MKPNQLGEKIVPIDFHFQRILKDGKLWSYVMSEDDLGFACYFDFSNW